MQSPVLLHRVARSARYDAIVRSLCARDVHIRSGATGISLARAALSRTHTCTHMRAPLRVTHSSAAVATGVAPSVAADVGIAVSAPALPGDAVESTRAASVGVAAHTRTHTDKPRSLLSIYAELSKARLSALVVFTSGAGFLMAGLPTSYPALVACVAGTSLASMCASVCNQVSEAALDARMMRTARRPLPAGLISPSHASWFAFGTGAASSAVLLAGTNPLTASLALANIALYAAVYTPLKRVSVWNTAVGAIVGAVPPVIGWAAATYTGAPWDVIAWMHTITSPEPLLLAATLFWWQFPHFYALSWNLRKDYARGGYAMTPVLDATGGKHTAWLSLRSTLALATLPFAATALGVTAPMFAVEGLVLNGYFLRLAYQFYADPSDASARRLFRTSLWYLPVLLILAVFHSVHWMRDEAAAARGDASQSGAEPARLSGRYDVPLQERISYAVALQAASVRELGRALCLHEMAARGDDIAKPSVVMGAVMQALRPQAGAAPPVHPNDAPAIEAAVGALKESTRARCPLTTEAPAEHTPASR